ncbi:methyltransferase, partial [Candidatus Bathyarchaeota archaeon]|nr:methyltransferase [Candidatus Bathyarchaeota archaeon]
MVDLRKQKPIEVLDKDDMTNIHLKSLELLEKMGVKVHSEEALTILEESGADVDHEKQMAKIPPHLVEEALRKAPNSFELCARNPKKDVKL